MISRCGTHERRARQLVLSLALGPERTGFETVAQDAGLVSFYGRLLAGRADVDALGVSRECQECKRGARYNP